MASFGVRLAAHTDQLLNRQQSAAIAGKLVIGKADGLAKAADNFMQMPGTGILPLPLGVGAIAQPIQQTVAVCPAHRPFDAIARAGVVSLRRAADSAAIGQDAAVIVGHCPAFVLRIIDQLPK